MMTDKDLKLSKLLKRWGELRCLDFKPFPYQERMLRSLASKVFLQTGNQQGKSESAAYEAVCYFRGFHPYKKLPKYNSLVIWMVSETMTSAIEVFYERKLKRMIPVDEYREVKEVGQLVGLEHKQTKNRIYFKAMAKGSSRLQSVSVDLIIIDEMPPDFDTLMELFARVQAVKGRILMTFTPLKHNKEIKEFLAHKDINIEVIKATAYDCPMYTLEEIELAKKTLPDAQFKTRWLGEWISYAGALLPSFGDHLVIPSFEVPLEWKKILIVDPATSGLAGMSIITEDPRKEDPKERPWYLIKEAMVSNISPVKLVDYAEEFSKEFKIDTRLSDVHENYFIKTAREERGINYLGVVKDTKESMTVNLDNTFARQRVKIFDNCSEVVKQIVNYCNKDHTDKFDPVRGDFHILDTLIYFNEMIDVLATKKEETGPSNPMWKLVEKQFYNKKKDTHSFSRSM